MNTMENPYSKLEPFYEQYRVTCRDPTDQAYFSAAINIMLNEFDVSAGVFADKFGVSEGTLGRWVRGRSIPPSAARESILERMVELI